MGLKMRVLFAANYNNMTGDKQICPVASPFVAGKTYLVQRVAVINRSSSNSATLNLTVTSAGGASASVSPYNMSVPPNGQVILDDEITLAPVDGSSGSAYDKLILNIAGTTPNIDCVVIGLDRDL